jgi:ABC-type multidrug transport system fused ATPase/permease subunit
VERLPSASVSGQDEGSISLSKAWGILTPTERRQLLLLTPAVVGMAVLETVGVASIVPFLGLLSDPGILEGSRSLTWLYQTGNFTSRDDFFFAVGLAVLGLVTVGNTTSAMTTWGLLRFSWMRNHTLSTRLLRAYLQQPYTFFLEQNSANLGKNLLSEVQAVVTGVLVQGVQLSARAVVALGVSMALFFLDPLMAVGILVVFGGVYGTLFVAVRRNVSRSGRERIVLNQQRHKTAHESLAGVKELKLYGLEPVAVAQFSMVSEALATRQASNAVIAQIPRYALETIAFGGVLLIVLYLLRAGRRLEDVLPVLGLYAFAAYRLLPALQTIFAGLTALRFNLGALDVLYADLVEREAMTSVSLSAKSVRFDTAVALEHVSFRYRAAVRPTLEHIDLTISAGEWVAIVGPTGAGKSTLVDLLLGLLAPDEGCVRVDDVSLDDDAARLGWQSNVAYVPQQIFLVDDTVLRNIAFGLPDKDIDRERAIAAARIAQIDGFVQNELPQGYDTPIGECGVRLSGGQRQRIGIARALYRQPRLLVLDEATSALDNATEAAFFAALHSSHHETAVISIAHRLSTTRDFDRIVVLERGRIVDTGTFPELEARSAHFRVGKEAA